MDIRRILKHLLTTHAQVARAFPPSALAEIEKAIAASETSHSGELRFVVEGALDGAPLFSGQSPRERAIALFSQLRIWDTEHNNGLLIYLLLADHAVEIVADRGIDAKVGSEVWRQICRQMEAAFRQSAYQAGVLAGVQAVTQQLARHFPPDDRGNELSDKPLIV
jgi:uncharacterized membrane protein